MAHVGILDPDPDTVGTLERVLRAAGHQTVVAVDRRAAVDLVARGDVDLMILGGAGGLDALRELRAAGAALPIVVLADPDRADDVVAALDAGADDVLRTPFRTDELVARAGRLLSAAGGPGLVLTAGDLELDLREGQVRVGTRPVALTSRELRLLETFLLHPRETLSPQRLVALSYGADHPGDFVSIEREVYSLSSKLGPCHIEIVIGRGYRLYPSDRSPAPPTA